MSEDQYYAINMLPETLKVVQPGEFKATFTHINIEQDLYWQDMFIDFLNSPNKHFIEIGPANHSASFLTVKQRIDNLITLDETKVGLIILDTKITKNENPLKTTYDLTLKKIGHAAELFNTMFVENNANLVLTLKRLEDCHEGNSTIKEILNLVALPPSLLRYSEEAIAKIPAYFKKPKEV